MRFSLLLTAFVFCFSNHLDAGDKPNLSRGRALYVLCSSCHGPTAHGNHQFHTPALAGLPDWYIADQLKRFLDGRRGAHPKDQHGLMMRPMAKTLRSEEDLTAVSAYIASLKPKIPEVTITEGDPEKGKAMYMICMACHGDKLQGNPMLKSPPLKHLQDWYQLAQLKKFKHSIRFDPKDPQSLQMQAMTAGLPNEETMRDIVVYISQVVNGKIAGPTLPGGTPAPPTPPPPSPKADKTSPEKGTKAATPKAKAAPKGGKAKAEKAKAAQPK